MGDGSSAREPAGLVARRIVEEVLAAHDAAGSAPGGVAPPIRSEAPEKAASGAVRMGDGSSAVEPAGLVARRIVEEVLAAGDAAGSAPGGVAPPIRSEAPEKAGSGAVSPDMSRPGPEEGAARTARPAVAPVAQETSPAPVQRPAPGSWDLRPSAPGSRDRRQSGSEPSGPRARSSRGQGGPREWRQRWDARQQRRRELTGWAPGAGPAPRRTFRWLLVTLLGAGALALLFPLAVEAVRDLVAL